MKTLNKILIIVAVFLFLFIGTMCYFFYKFQAVPDTLVTCVLGTGTAELIVSALIEITKKRCDTKEKEDSNDSQDS